MKITDNEQNITEILDVYKNRFRPGNPQIRGRRSDCFVFVLSGGAEYVFAGKSVTVQAGDIIYLAHNSQYSIRVSVENYTFFYVNFFFDHPQQEVFENEVFSVRDPNAMEKNFEKLYLYWKKGDFADRVEGKALLYRIYSEIIRTRLSQYVSVDCRTRLDRAVEYIAAHFTRADLTVGELSRVCGISEGHFRRTFACIYHTSPMKYVTALRIKRAKELLRTEACPIAEIAASCGFVNHYYFCKVFKAETGITPGSYRRFFDEKQ